MGGWLVPVILTLKEWRQADWKFKAILNCIHETQSQKKVVEEREQNMKNI